MSPSIETLPLLTPFAEIQDPALEIPDKVPGLHKPLFHWYNPWKPENNPLAVVQCMHANLGPQSVSNSGSPQDHLPMSIILSAFKHLYGFKPFPVNFRIAILIPNNIPHLWMLGHQPFRGSSNSTITVNFRLLNYIALSLFNITILTSTQLTSRLYESPSLTGPGHPFKF